MRSSERSFANRAPASTCTRDHPANHGPGDKLEAQAGVSVDGRGTYVDVSARTAIHVHVDPLPALDPATLFYSDDPDTSARNSPAC